MTQTHLIPALIAALGFIAPLPAAAQSALGFRDAQVTLTYGASQNEPLQSIDAALDVSITRSHGLQLTFGAISYPDTYFGQIGAHLYMAPGDTAKYGLFAAYSDADDENDWEGLLGIEGLWRFGDAVAVEARAGIGILNPDSYDYIFVEANAHYALSDRLALSGGFKMTDLEETRLALRSTEMTLGLTYYIPTAPVELSLGLSRSTINGTIDASEELRATAQLTVHLGGARSARADVHDRFFSASHPLKEILLRDLLAE